MNDTTKDMRRVASCLSYNDPNPTSSAKHFLLWGAGRIEDLEKDNIALRQRISDATSPEGVERARNELHNWDSKLILDNEGLRGAIKSALLDS